jgi:hypothetical protein
VVDLTRLDWWCVVEELHGMGPGNTVIYVLPFGGPTNVDILPNR